jgi:hypothetical protein
MLSGDNVQTVNFNIYNKVRMKVRAEKGYRRVLKRLRVEYGFFERNNYLDEANMIVTIGSVDGFPSDYVKINDRYLIGGDWIYICDSYKVAKWKIYMEFESHCINLHIEPNFFACDLIPPIIITPLIGFQLNRNRLSLVHAAGISFGGNAFLFTGFGGSGKTSIVLRFLERGLKLLGDDHVILDRSKVLPFPTAISLFKYNLFGESDWIKRRKLEIELKSLIHKFTLGYIYPVTKARLKDYDLIAEGSELRKAILVEPRISGDCTVEEVGKQEFIDSWMQNILFDGMYLYKYLCAFSYVNQKFFNYLSNFKETLSRNLVGCQRFIRVNFPQNDVEKLFKTICSILENG